jgi:hypothetical protein
MHAGVATAEGLIGGSKALEGIPRLIFVTLVGVPTSSNLVKAFQQGVTGERANEVHAIKGLRCEGCGYLELYATDPRVV